MQQNSISEADDVEVLHNDTLLEAYQDARTSKRRADVLQRMAIAVEDDIVSGNLDPPVPMSTKRSAPAVQVLVALSQLPFKNNVQSPPPGLLRMKGV